MNKYIPSRFSISLSLFLKVGQISSESTIGGDVTLLKVSCTRKKLKGTFLPLWTSRISTNTVLPHRYIKIFKEIHSNKKKRFFATFHSTKTNLNFTGRLRFSIFTDQFQFSNIFVAINRLLCSLFFLSHISNPRIGFQTPKK